MCFLEERTVRESRRDERVHLCRDLAGASPSSDDVLVVYNGDVDTVHAILSRSRMHPIARPLSNRNVVVSFLASGNLYQCLPDTVSSTGFKTAEP